MITIEFKNQEFEVESPFATITGDVIASFEHTPHCKQTMADPGCDESFAFDRIEWIRNLTMADENGNARQVNFESLSAADKARIEAAFAFGIKCASDKYLAELVEEQYSNF